MSAIITEKFRQHNAGNFFESFSESSANVYYLMIGKATPFTSATTGGSDPAPPTPTSAFCFFPSGSCQHFLGGLFCQS